MSDNKKTYTLRAAVGIAFPPTGEDAARKVGKALVGAGLECELTRQTIDGVWYLSVNPGLHPDGLEIPQDFAHSIVNQCGGRFSGSSVAALINRGARAAALAGPAPKP